jgi:hypothetical protein
MGANMGTALFKRGYRQNHMIWVQVQYQQQLGSVQIRIFNELWMRFINIHFSIYILICLLMLIFYYFKVYIY